MSPLGVLFEIYVELGRCFMEAISLCMYSISDVICQYDYSAAITEMKEQTIKCLEPVILECVFKVNRNIVYANQYLKQLYNTNVAFMVMSDLVYEVCVFINNIATFIYNYVMYVRIEPSGEWISFHVLTATNVGRILYEEEYLYFEEEDVESQIGNMDGLMSKCLINIFMGKYYYDYLGEYTKSPQICTLMTEEMVNTVVEQTYNMMLEKTNDNALVVVKKRDAYTVRVFTPQKHGLFLLSNSLSHSSVKFMMVRYLHPNILSPIAIHLSREYFYEDNELLSREFVLRYLEYLPRNMSYVFDDDYIVEILDDNFRLIRLSSRQYIVLGKDDYSVKDVSQNTSAVSSSPSLVNT